MYKLKYTVTLTTFHTHSHTLTGTMHFSGVSDGRWLQSTYKNFIHNKKKKKKFQKTVHIGRGGFFLIVFLHKGEGGETELDLRGILLLPASCISEVAVVALLIALGEPPRTLPRGRISFTIVGKECKIDVKKVFSHLNLIEI